MKHKRINTQPGYRSSDGQKQKQEKEYESYEEDSTRPSKIDQSVDTMSAEEAE